MIAQGGQMAGLSQQNGLYKAGLTTDLATTNANLSLTEFAARQSLAQQKRDSKFGLDNLIDIGKIAVAASTGAPISQGPLSSSGSSPSPSSSSGSTSIRLGGSGYSEYDPYSRGK